MTRCSVEARRLSVMIPPPQSVCVPCFDVVHLLFGRDGQCWHQLVRARRSEGWCWMYVGIIEENNGVEIAVDENYVPDNGRYSCFDVGMQCGFLLRMRLGGGNNWERRCFSINLEICGLKADEERWRFAVPETVPSNRDHSRM